MITLKDDDAVGLVLMILEVAETMLESLVRKGIFNKSDLEWFATDVDAGLRSYVRSDLARRTLVDHLALLHTELLRQFEENARSDA